jgi:hypothetical protein
MKGIHDECHLTPHFTCAPGLRKTGEAALEVWAAHGETELGPERHLTPRVGQDARWDVSSFEIILSEERLELVPKRSQHDDLTIHSPISPVHQRG